MNKKKDYAKAVFGKLTVSHDIGKANGQYLWVCDCACLNDETRSLRASTHGASRTVEYRAYQEAKRRCMNPVRPEYPYYGGRGIKFLFQTFEEFLNDVGAKPSPQHELDRKNNEGHYEVGNVHWVTHSQQMRNRRPWTNKPRASQ